MAYIAKRFGASRRDLDLIIQKGDIPNAIFLYGECEFFVSQYGESVANTVASRDDQYRFYFGEYDFESIKNVLSQSSLFGDKSLVLLKAQKPPTKNELSSLISLVDKNRSNFFIFELYKSPTKSQGEYSKACRDVEATFKSEKDCTYSVRFFLPNYRESIEILKNRATSLEIKISEHLLEQMIIMQDNNIALAYNELEKLKILDKEIEAKDINNLCFGLGSVSIEELILKIINDNDMMLYVSRVLDEGVEEVMIINAITSFFVQLLTYHSYIKTHGNIDVYEITGIRNLPKHIYERNANLSIKYKERDYLKIITHLNSSSLALKQHSGDKNSIFLSSLIKLKEYLK